MIYLVAVLILMAVDPLCVLQLNPTDDNGNTSVVRGPLRGLYSCEWIVSLQEIERGLVWMTGVQNCY